jgi:hypothetical protein
MMNSPPGMKVAVETAATYTLMLRAISKCGLTANLPGI